MICAFLKVFRFAFLRKMKTMKKEKRKKTRPYLSSDPGIGLLQILMSAPVVDRSSLIFSPPLPENIRSILVFYVNLLKLKVQKEILPEQTSFIGSILRQRELYIRY